MLKIGGDCLFIVLARQKQTTLKILIILFLTDYQLFVCAGFQKMTSTS